MKSIRWRFLRTNISAVLIVFLLASAAALYYVHLAVAYHSAKMLESLSLQKKTEMNLYLDNIEQSTHVLEQYIFSTIDIERFRTDASYVSSFLEDVNDNARRLCKIANYAKTFFFAANPDEFGAGRSLMLLNPGSLFYTSVEFDIASYPATDLAHVGWYYVAKDIGKAAWLPPHPNANIEYGANTATYVVPLYSRNTLVGIIGMDMNLALLRKVIDNLDIRSAFGFLISSDGDILYHKDFPNGLAARDFSKYADARVLQKFFAKEYVDTGKNYAYSWHNVDQRLIVSKMRNGMLLGISIPEPELYSIRTKMLSRMGVLLVFVLLVSFLLMQKLSAYFVQPIQMLTEITSRVARGELNADVTYVSDDEFGLLADSIRKIMVELKEYIRYIKRLAYADAMTGCRNKSAYIDRVKVLQQRMNEEMADFTLYIFDVNGLKRMNDTFGHEYGDMLIKDAANILKGIFKEENIYRTGGDEFVVIDENTTQEHMDTVYKLFDEHVAAFNSDNDRYSSELAISKGAAICNSQTDRDFNAVFARADEAMYACKAAYYKTHGDRRRS